MSGLIRIILIYVYFLKVYDSISSTFGKQLPLLFVGKNKIMLEVTDV
jgi:hypothetical protein